jgi:O-antigen ligase
MEDEGLGTKFWLGTFGVLLAAAVGVFIVLLIFFRAAYAWGFFGAFMLLFAVLILVAWIWDRRRNKQFEEDYNS